MLVQKVQKLQKIENAQASLYHYSYLVEQVEVLLSTNLTNLTNLTHTLNTSHIHILTTSHIHTCTPSHPHTLTPSQMLCERLDRIHRESMETIVCEETEMNRVSEEGNGGSGKNIAIKLGIKKSREHFYIIFVNLKFEVSCF